MQILFMPLPVSRDRKRTDPTYVWEGKIMHQRIEILTELIPGIVDDYKTHFEPKLERIPDGSGRAREAGLEAGWISGLSMFRPTVHDLPYTFTAALATLLREVGTPTIKQLMVNAVAPGKALNIHVDGPPYYNRWHLPIITHPEVKVWTMEHGTEHFELGHWAGPLNYRLRHGIEVPPEIPEARVHFIADLGGEV